MPINTIVIVELLKMLGITEFKSDSVHEPEYIDYSEERFETQENEIVVPKDEKDRQIYVAHDGLPAV